MFFCFFVLFVLATDLSAPRKQWDDGEGGISVAYVIDNVYVIMPLE